MGNSQFTVLFADDDENDIILTQRALRKLGLNQMAGFVRHGFELMDYLDGRGMFYDRSKYPLPHLIITDLKMPRCSGFEAIKWLRQQPAFREIPVYILTSSSQERDIQTARGLGVWDYFKKPADYRELQQLLADVLARWINPEQNSGTSVSSRGLIQRTRKKALAGIKTAPFLALNPVRIPEAQDHVQAYQI